MIKNKIKKHSLSNYLYVFMILYVIMLLVINPANAMIYFQDGIVLWATKILPALLPFFILTKLLSYTNFTTSLGKFLTPITQRLYGVGGIAGYVYIMSIISGYPVGAKLTSDLYKNKIISKEQAYTITSFTSTSGPLFILGTISIGMFKNNTLGIIILISHMLSAIINGLLYRNKANNKTKTLSSPTETTNILNDSMLSSISSIVVVGGFVSLFYMILKLLISINFFSLPLLILSKFGIIEELGLGIITGLFEVTTGINFLSSSPINIKLATVITSCLVSFGGLSIHAQAYCFLRDFEMKYSTFLKQKVTHAIISTLVTSILILLF